MQTIEELSQQLQALGFDNPVPDFVTRDVKWLSKKHEAYILDNVNLAFGIFSKKCPIGEKASDYATLKQSCIKAANENDNIEARRMYAILINYFELFSLLLMLKPNSSKDTLNPSILKIYRLLRSVSLWHQSIRNLLSFSDVCEDTASCLFTTKISNGHKESDGVVCVTNSTILANMRKESVVSGQNLDYTTVLGKISFPAYSAAKRKSLWREFMPMPLDKNALDQYLAMISFFQAYLVRDDSLQNLDEYNERCNSLNELLILKRRCAVQLINHLDTNELQRFYYDKVSSYTNIDRESEDANSKGMNLSHILQDYESWLIEYLLESIYQRNAASPRPHALRDKVAPESPTKKLRM